MMVRFTGQLVLAKYCRRYLPLMSCINVRLKVRMAAVLRRTPILLMFLCMSVVLVKIQAQELIITEICASNDSGLLDPDFGKHTDWIEVYNTGNQDVWLGNFYMTDDPNIPLKWKFPDNQVVHSQQYLIIYADDENTGLHTNFKLSMDGEFIGIFKNYETVIDSFTFPEQKQDVSYGRNPQDSRIFEFYTRPTPGFKNEEPGYTCFLSEPAWTLPAGYYHKPFELNLKYSIDHPVYFTTDGSLPSSSSNIWTGNLNINQTTVVKAVSIKEGCISSETISQTFIVRDKKHQLPVVSISTHPKHLFDDSTGIYVIGINGKTGYCDNLRKRNYCQDWERPAYFEFFDEHGRQQISMNVGIKIHGNCSRNAAQKSLAIYARKKYGKGKMKYPFFKDKPHISEFEAIILRNSGNDNNRSHMRDGLTTSLVKQQMDIDWQAYQPVVVYLNDAYWGIMNMREKLNEHYLASNHNIDHRNIDFLEVDQNIRNGSNQSYLEFIDSIKTLNTYYEPEKTYEFIQSKIDMREYMNYMITELYAGNTDWPRTNWRHWKQQSTDAKWRWVLYDTDYGFGLHPDGVSHNTVKHAIKTNPLDPTLPSGAFLFQNLMESKTFRTQFINEFLYHLDHTFKPARVIHTIDSLKQKLSPEIQEHAERWNMDLNSWENELEHMKEFAIKRPAYIHKFLEPYVSADIQPSITDKP